MVTVPEPQYDPRFSTQAALNRTVVTNWVRERAGDVLDEWFAKGYPHKRLATEAMEAAVGEGWIEGAQKIWDSGWVAKGVLLRAAWNRQPWLRRKLRAVNDQDTPMEAWLIEKTWGPTDGVDKEWARGQVNARVTALLNALRDPVAWDRYLGLGVNMANPGGRDLLERVMIARFPWYLARNEKVVEGAAREQLDRQLDQMLGLPEDHRASATSYNLVRLLQGTINPEWDDGTRQTSWSVLQRLLTAPRSALDATDLGMTLCEMALVGRAGAVPQDRLEVVRDRLLAWGAPASFTLSEEEMAYGGRYHGLVRNQYGYVSAPDVGHRERLRADHVAPIRAENPTVHVGDHWFAVLTPPEKAWNRAQVEPLTDAQKAEYRARFEALVEAAELTATAARSRRPRRPKAT